MQRRILVLSLLLLISVLLSVIYLPGTDIGFTDTKPNIDEEDLDWPESWYAKGKTLYKPVYMGKVIFPSEPSHILPHMDEHLFSRDDFNQCADSVSSIGGNIVVGAQISGFKPLDNGARITFNVYPHAVIQGSRGT